MKISNINYLDIVKILLFTILIFFWDLKIKVFDTIINHTNIFIDYSNSYIISFQSIVLKDSKFILTVYVSFF